MKFDHSNPWSIQCLDVNRVIKQSFDSGSGRKIGAIKFPYILNHDEVSPIQELSGLHNEE